MSATNGYLSKTLEWYARLPAYQKVRPKAEMNDGFVVSIQASETHFCAPRLNGLDNYSMVELGYPSEKDDLIMEYAETPEEPTSAVYGYVPVDVVDALIEKHGGLKE